MADFSLDRDKLPAPSPTLRDLQDRHLKALDKLEHAQSLVCDACQEISLLDGLSDQWSDLIDLYSKIRESWDTLKLAKQKILTPAESELMSKEISSIERDKGCASNDDISRLYQMIFDARKE